MNVDGVWKRLNAEVVACKRCPRLVNWREKVAVEKRRAYRDWDYWGKPVTGLGDTDAQLVIIGLAPAAHGANRTGRMFTGDSSADTLTSALYRSGFANQPASSSRDDGLELRNVYITAVARCAPPGNKPTTEELRNCRPYLERELELVRSARVVLALGRIAFEVYLRLLRESGREVPRLSFSHGAVFEMGLGQPALVVSYHPSQQNTQTGRLTVTMLDDVFDKIRELLGD